jgi:crotonobetainyl-CoA:carnitine CoA-transferase CaiB-like acyl-CoA transferase
VAQPPKELWDKIAGLYRCGDGRWVRLHTNFPHHRDGVLKLLGCDYSREAVQRALDGWQAEDSRRPPPRPGWSSR